MNKYAQIYIEEFNKEAGITSFIGDTWGRIKNFFNGNKDNAQQDASDELFPGGKLRYQPTQLKMPSGMSQQAVSKGVDGLPTSVTRLSYADFGNQQLQNIEGGAEKFLEEQRKHYSEAEAKGFKPTRREENVDVAIVDNKLNDKVQPKYIRTPKGGSGVISMKNPLFLPLSNSASAEYNGFQYDKSKGGVTLDPASTTAHELGHHFTRNDTTSPPTQVANSNKPDVRNSSYSSDRIPELNQSSVSTLNTFRDVTGKKLNDEQSVNRLFDEVEKNPTILDQMPQEGTRQMREYLMLKEKGQIEKANNIKNHTATNANWLAGRMKQS